MRIGARLHVCRQQPNSSNLCNNMENGNRISKKSTIKKGGKGLCEELPALDGHRIVQYVAIKLTFIRHQVFSDIPYDGLGYIHSRVVPAPSVFTPSVVSPCTIHAATFVPEI